MADLALIPVPDGEQPTASISDAVDGFIAFVRETLGDAVSDVRALERLTKSPLCLVAPEHGIDRQLAKLLVGADRLDAATGPVLKINPRHALVEKLDAVWLNAGATAPVDGLASMAKPNVVQTSPQSSQ